MDCVVSVLRNTKTDSLPYCLFLNNEGDKSIENYYKKLKEHFEKKKRIESKRVFLKSRNNFVIKIAVIVVS